MRLLKYVIVLMLTLVAITTITSIASAEEIAAGVVTATKLNVRTQPSTSSDVIIQLPKGDVVSIQWVDGEWYQIKLPSGTLGFINSAYVDVRRGSAQISRSSSAETRSAGRKICDTASNYLGTRYVYGGTSPNGFDCSGFTQYIFNQNGISLNRTSREQFNQGTPVSKNNLKPGDLLFFSTRRDRTITHVGIYVGDGKMIHSPQTGMTVSYVTINEGHYLNTYVGARRITN